MIKHTLLFISGIAFACAASPGPGSVFGSSNDTAFVDANRNPNITKSVPFQMGDRNFTFRVNIAEFTPDTSTSIQDPRIAASFYALEWSGPTDLNDTIAAAESLNEGQMPRLCASFPLGLLSASANNGYDEKDDGDCTGALGKDCVNDLKQSGYDLGVNCLPNLPESCSGKFGHGGIGSGCEFLHFKLFFFAQSTYFDNSITQLGFTSKLVRICHTNVSVQFLPVVISSIPCWEWYCL